MSKSEIETISKKDIVENGTKLEVPRSKIPLITNLKQLLEIERNPKKNKKVTINLTGTRYNVVINVARDYFTWNCILNTKDSTEDWNIQWYDTYISNDTLRNMMPFQKINHFPGSYELGRKNLLCKNLAKMRKYAPNEYNFAPRTWLLPYQFEELKFFAQGHEDTRKKHKHVFIIKPEASCQGRGIYLAKKLDGLSPTDHCVVQEYVTDPYLIDNLKFDLRIYALVKSIHPLKIFIYREGMARFATFEYQKPKKANMKNLCMHLTNYAVNKKNPEFIPNNDEEDDGKGHKRSLSSILRHIEEQGGNPEAVFGEICSVVAKTIISVQPHLAHVYKSCQPKEENSEMCFELFGFDIMLDRDLKAWLLEVNHTPSFQTDSNFDLQLKKNLIIDTLSLINVSNKAKKQYFDSKGTPYLEKKFTKINPVELEKMRNHIKNCEDKHMGGYFRIFPESDAFNRNLAPLLEIAKTTWNDFTNPRKRHDSELKEPPLTISVSNPGNVVREAPLPTPKSVSRSANIKSLISRPPPLIKYADRRCSENTEREPASENNLDKLEMPFTADNITPTSGLTRQTWVYSKPYARDIQKQTKKLDKLAFAVKLDKYDKRMKSGERTNNSVILEPISKKQNQSSNSNKFGIPIDHNFLSGFSSYPLDKLYERNLESSPNIEGKNALMPVPEPTLSTQTAEELQAEEQEQEKDEKIAVINYNSGLSPTITGSTTTTVANKKYSFRTVNFPQNVYSVKLNPLEHRTPQVERKNTPISPVKVSRAGSANPKMPLANIVSNENAEPRRDLIVPEPTYRENLCRSTTPVKTKRQENKVLILKGLKNELNKTHDDRINQNFENATDRLPVKKTTVKPYSYELPFNNTRDAFRIGFVKLQRRFKLVQNE